MRVRIFCIVIALFSYSTHTTANEYHRSQDIHQDVSNFLTRHYDDQYANPTTTSEIEISVNRIDPRLKLFKCANPLTLSLKDSGNIGGNIAVKTQCQGEKPWSIYVSAKVSIYEDVLVAMNHLPRGTVIDESDIDFARINISEIGNYFADDFNQVIGKSLSRPIKRGSPIRLTQLKEPTVIKRGQEVVIEAQSSGIMVAAYATALSDGRIGEQIKVKNTQSNQIVKATVINQGRVGVRF